MKLFTKRLWSSRPYYTTEFIFEKKTTTKTWNLSTGKKSINSRSTSL